MYKYQVYLVYDLDYALAVSNLLFYGHLRYLSNLNLINLVI